MSGSDLSALTCPRDHPLVVKAKQYLLIFDFFFLGSSSVFLAFLFLWGKVKKPSYYIFVFIKESLDAT